jgi:Fe-S oxidoreductase
MLLDSAREHLAGVFAVLPDAVADETPVIVLEPSCFAVFKDEARALAGDRPFARALAEQAVLFEAFLRPHFERGERRNCTAACSHTSTVTSRHSWDASLPRRHSPRPV